MKKQRESPELLFIPLNAYNLCMAQSVPLDMVAAAVFQDNINTTENVVEWVTGSNIRENVLALNTVLSKRFPDITERIPRNQSVETKHIDLFKLLLLSQDINSLNGKNLYSLGKDCIKYGDDVLLHIHTTRQYAYLIPDIGFTRWYLASSGVDDINDIHYWIIRAMSVSIPVAQLCNMHCVNAFVKTLIRRKNENR